MKEELLRFTTAGSVDDGKSTLIGRLLYDSKSIFVSSKFYRMDWNWPWHNNWPWTFFATIKISVDTTRRVCLFNR